MSHRRQDGKSKLEATGGASHLPPSALTKIGVVSPREYWLAQKALYGFKAPYKAWGETRGAMLHEVAVFVEGRTIRLLQSVTRH